METTRDERSRGVLIISAMKLKDFLTLIDRKIDEFEDKAAQYMDECRDNLAQQDMPEPEYKNCLRYHEIYLQKNRDMLAEFKKTTEKYFDDNHKVPTVAVEMFVGLARKATSIKYSRIEPALQKIN